jgi:hypothetical protein
MEIELNKNGRAKINKEAHRLYDLPAKKLALRTLKLIYPESEFSYSIVETFQFGDIIMTEKRTGQEHLGEVEARNERDHTKNMIGAFPEVNITLKNNLESLHNAGKKGFCISVNMADLEKEYASAFYITLLKDIAVAPKKKSYNWRGGYDEYFFKLRNDQVQRFKLDQSTYNYSKINLIQEKNNDYYN